MSGYNNLFKLASLGKTVALKSTTTNQNVRWMSNQPRKTFFGGFFENLKEEFNKNKDMKDSISKFREEAKKLEQSDSLKEARKKYKELGDETVEGSKVFKEKFESLAGKVKESEFGKKAAEAAGDFAKQAQKAAETVSKQTVEFSQSTAYKKVSENVKAIKENIDEATQLSQIKPYRKPEKLRKRSEIDESIKNKVYESNTEDTGMVLHKDSKFYQSWQNFKENNAYINKLFEFKTQYDESDNPVVRATRVITDKFTSVFGGMFKSTEMSEVLTEIVKIDPTFELNEFLKRVQYDIIPNILESLSQGELEILKDWCTEASFNILTHPITQCKQLKMKYHNEVLDINNLEIAGGKIMEQGPVLILSFTAQQLLYVTNSEGKVIEGDKDKIKRISHIWVLLRDQNIFDPNSAWRLAECAMHQTEQYI